MSGFFGGLSGHQGAFRSAFLAKAGLSREAFLGTNIAIACLVDLARIGVYGTHFRPAALASNVPLLMAAAASAFTGAWIGSRLVKKVTLRALQFVVGSMLLFIALALGAGLL